jgi:hypothetical protein
MSLGILFHIYSNYLLSIYRRSRKPTGKNCAQNFTLFYVPVLMLHVLNKGGFHRISTSLKGGGILFFSHNNPLEKTYNIQWEEYLSHRQE